MRDEYSFYTRREEKENIFATKEWQNYDYQKDIENDVELQSVKPVGREVVD